MNTTGHANRFFSLESNRNTHVNRNHSFQGSRRIAESKSSDDLHNLEYQEVQRSNLFSSLVDDENFSEQTSSPNSNSGFILPQLPVSSPINFIMQRPPRLPLPFPLSRSRVSILCPQVIVPYQFSHRLDRMPVFRVISKREKNSLSYYYKNNSYHYCSNINLIRQRFSSDSRKIVLLKSINTIQFLLNTDGCLYPRVIDAIKNELYFSCLFDGLSTPLKSEISAFIDEVVQLSRYRPSFFSSPERTRSIKKLFQYLNLNLQNKTVFAHMELINNTTDLSFVDISSVELSHRIPSQRFNTAYYNLFNLRIRHLEFIDSEENTRQQNELIREESPSSDDSILSQLGSAYNPIDDYPKPNFTLNKIYQIQTEIHMASMSYMEILNVLKNHWKSKESPGVIEIEVHGEKENLSGITKIQIELIDIITQDNILLNFDENEQFMFIARERDGTLFLNPYTPDSFNGTIDALGLVEQTTRLPILLQDDDAVNLKSSREDYWSILSKDLFMKLFVEL